MVIWITGDRGSGKTTLAKELCRKMNAINLDGDTMRLAWPELGFTEEDRLLNNKRIAYLAKGLSEQGFDVICSTICPEYVRQEVYWICKCKFIHL